MIKQGMLCAILISLMTNCTNQTMLNNVNFSKFIDIVNTNTVPTVNKAKKAIQIEAYTDYDTPDNNSFKSYMAYTTITDKNSSQYKLQRNAITEECGIRMVENRYCIAVGSYYTTQIGTKVDLIMENGNIVECILADCKADIHTDFTRRQNKNGSIVEFIIDNNKLDKTAKKMGDISYCKDEFKGQIKTIRIYNN